MPLLLLLQRNPLNLKRELGLRNLFKEIRTKTKTRTNIIAIAVERNLDLILQLLLLLHLPLLLRLHHLLLQLLPLLLLHLHLFLLLLLLLPHLLHQLLWHLLLAHAQVGIYNLLTLKRATPALIRTRLVVKSLLTITGNLRQICLQLTKRKISSTLSLAKLLKSKVNLKARLSLTMNSGNVTLILLAFQV